MDQREAIDIREYRAFILWAQANYKTHAVGALALAVYLYESCRSEGESIAWDLMQFYSKQKHWSSEVWLDVAQQILSETNV